MAQAQARLDEVNARHATTIRSLLLDVLKNSDRDAAPVDNGEFEPLGGRRYGTIGHLRIPEGHTSNFVPISEIMRSSNKQRDRVVALPPYVKESSNRSRLVAKFILKNLDALLLNVPSRTEEFELLASQRLAVLVLTTPLPRDAYTELSISRQAMQDLTSAGRRKAGFTKRLTLPRGSLPVFSLADFPTGSGKTVVALMAALSLLCAPARWDDLQAGYRQILRDRLMHLSLIHI